MTQTQLEQKREKNRLYMREYSKRKKLEAKLEGKKSITFTGPDKDIVRETILNSARETNDLLDLYGTGQMFNKVRKEAKKINITSIDTGQSFNNSTLIKQAAKKDPKHVKEISFANYANTATEAEQKGTIWLDFCSAFSSPVIENLEIAQKAMKKKGYLYVTLMNGREQFMAKGTARRVTNKVFTALMKEILRENGITAKPCFNHEYKSSPNYEGRNKWKEVQMSVYGYKYTKNEAYIKRKEEKEAQANLKKLKSTYSKKEIRDMVKALEFAGYSINQPE